MEILNKEFIENTLFSIPILLVFAFFFIQVKSMLKFRGQTKRSPGRDGSNVYRIGIILSVFYVIRNNTANIRHISESFIILLVMFICTIQIKVWPVSLFDLYHIYFGHPGSILTLAHDCMLKKRDFWSIRDYIFWGQKTCILTSEKSVNAVLNNSHVFQRRRLEGDCVTSSHTILGSGGADSALWKRLRNICRPFFNRGDFDTNQNIIVHHIIDSVLLAIENAPEDGLDLFQLMNRLVVESHLIAILGIENVPSRGKDIPVRDAEGNDTISSKCMADIIDESLIQFTGEPKFTSESFAPMMTWLTDRLLLPKDQLGGIERLLAEACKSGQISTMERLHNTVMYMIALAPSPAAFWTIVHVYKDKKLLSKIREESDDENFSMLAMCIKETLRMYAPVPIMVGRCVKNAGSNKAASLVGHDNMVLNDGDRILIPTIIIHNNEFLWVEPNKFNPERFDAPNVLPVEGNSSKAFLLRGSGIQPRPSRESSRGLGLAKPKARFFPFGQGKQTCLGQPYATWITMTITSVILQSFDMEIEDVEGTLDEEFSFQRVKDHIYSFPKSKFKAKVLSLVDEEGTEDDDVVEEMVREKSTRSDTLFKSLSRRRSVAFAGSINAYLPELSDFLQE